jgi:hypothetical protein
VKTQYRKRPSASRLLAFKRIRMLKIFISWMPWKGYLNPMLAIWRALIERGHEVVCLSTNALRFHAIRSRFQETPVSQAICRLSGYCQRSMSCHQRQISRRESSTQFWRSDGDRGIDRRQDGSERSRRIDGGRHRPPYKQSNFKSVEPRRSPSA